MFPLPFLWEQTNFPKTGTTMGQSGYPIQSFLGLAFGLLIGSPSEKMAEVMISIRTSNELILHFIKVVQDVCVREKNQLISLVLLLGHDQEIKIGHAVTPEREPTDEITEAAVDSCCTLSFVGPAPGIIKCKEYKNQTQLGNKLVSALNCRGVQLGVSTVRRLWLCVGAGRLISFFI